MQWYCSECTEKNRRTALTFFRSAPQRTQDPWEELRENVREAVNGYFFDTPAKRPHAIRLHLQRNDVLATT